MLLTSCLAPGPGRREAARPGASPTVDRGLAGQAPRRRVTDNSAALAPTDVAGGSAQAGPGAPARPGAVVCGSKVTPHRLAPHTNRLIIRPNV